MEITTKEELIRRYPKLTAEIRLEVAGEAKRKEQELTRTVIEAVQAWQKDDPCLSTDSQQEKLIREAAREAVRAWLEVHLEV